MYIIVKMLLDKIIAASELGLLIVLYLYQYGASVCVRLPIHLK